MFDLSFHADDFPASRHTEKTWNVFGLSSNEIMLFGANYSGSIRLWRVTISKSESSISWKTIKFLIPSESRLMFRRNYDEYNSTSLVFKLRDNIYLFVNRDPSPYPLRYARVTSCRFNIKEEKYYDNDVSGLPLNICRIISAITDKEETYCLLLCLVDLGLQYGVRLLFFNEADGIHHKMKDSNFLNSICKKAPAHSFDTLVRME